jgi:murein DD-endopeptidase MepM/ murein hydrolase activator NlpD
MPFRLGARTVRFGLGLAAVLVAGGGLGRPLIVARQQAAEAARPGAHAIERPASLPTFGQVGPATAVRRATRLHTETLERGRLNLLTYLVQRGDTASSIAERFGLAPQTILWGNEGLSSDAGNLQVGLELNILPVDGVLHTVREGDTLESLQAIYDVPAETIIEFPGNGLAGEETPALVPGQKLILPGATKAIAWAEPGPRVLAGQGRRSPGFYSGPLVLGGTGIFLWPVSPIRITQSYWSGHPAIDLDTYPGQAVYASDSGTVIYSDWDTTGYGNLIIIDHGNGLWTYYGHNKANLVRAGDGVLQGGQIAESGSTGNSTGEHLDFRIRLAEGGFLNPLDFLP